MTCHDGEEIRLFRVLCESDHKAYLPQGTSTGALRDFDALVATLRDWTMVDWIQLEVVRANRTVKGYRREVPSGRGAVHGPGSGGAQAAGET